MRRERNWMLILAFRLLYPHIVPIWMLLTNRVAHIVDFIVWPFLYILLNMQFAWLRLRARRCETEAQKKLSRKIYNIEGGSSLFLGLYEAGAALALRAVLGAGGDELAFGLVRVGQRPPLAVADQQRGGPLRLASLPRVQDPGQGGRW